MQAADTRKDGRRTTGPTSGGLRGAGSPAQPETFTTEERPMTTTRTELSLERRHDGEWLTVTTAEPRGARTVGACIAWLASIQALLDEMLEAVKAEIESHEASPVTRPTRKPVLALLPAAALGG